MRPFRSREHSGCPLSYVVLSHSSVHVFVHPHRLVHVGGVSHTALSAILTSLEVPVGPRGGRGRNVIGHIDHAIFDAIAHTVDMPLLTGEGTFTWEFANPCLLVAHLVHSSAHLAGVFAEALRRYPCTSASPWSLVVAWDEVCPGNKLRIDNTRKIMNLSFSFLQLGHKALCSDWGWFNPVSLRSCQIDRIRGGWSACLAVFLRVLLLGPDGFATSGLPLMLGEQPVLLVGRVSNLLSDGDGLRSGYNWRGHGSFKPCFVCFNMFKKALVRTLPHVNCTYLIVVGLLSRCSQTCQSTANTIDRYIYHWCCLCRVTVATTNFAAMPMIVLWLACRTLRRTRT
jgi:hypothetical protein